jgi:hypothetical protein
VVVGDVSLWGIVAQRLGFSDAKVRELLLQPLDVVTSSRAMERWLVACLAIVIASFRSRS